MTLRQPDIDRILANARRNFQSIAKNLDVHFVVHRLGGRNHALKQLYRTNKESPYADHLKALLGQWINLKGNDHKSEFLGLTEVSHGPIKNLVKKKHYITVLSLNLDNYISPIDFELDLYSLAWNICFIMKGKKFKKSPSSSSGKRIIIPQPSGSGHLLFNLKSDIFASLAVSLAHQQNAVEKLANIRALAVLKPQKKTLPEHYPFLIAIDQTIQILQDLQGSIATPDLYVEDAWKASETIDNVIDPGKLKLWFRFAQAAQDMAWRNFSPDQILSAAIDGNEDIEIRKLGILVSQLTTVQPSNYSQSRGLYNPYLNVDENERLHIEIIQEIFDSVLTRAVFINSALPFHEKAAEQNASLKEGRFMGWCAEALQKAGFEFDTALSNGQSPVHSARETFNKQIQKSTWDTIQDFGDKILQSRRLKQSIDLIDLWDIMKKDHDFSYIKDSIELSMNDGFIEVPESLKQAKEEEFIASNTGGMAFSPFYGSDKRTTDNRSSSGL